MRFAGLPMNHEFNSLVLASADVGGPHPSKAEPETLERIKELDGDYRFETYFSLSCQNCPDVIQALNLMTALNPAHPPRRHRQRLFPRRGVAARQ